MPSSKQLADKQVKSSSGFGLTKQQTAMVVVLLLGAVLVVLNQTLLSPALPTIMSDMQVDATTVQWLTSGYALVEAIIIPLNAFFMGRFRTRQLFIGGIMMFAVGTIVAALAPVFWVILLGRCMQACATGIIMPMVFTLILLVFPREKRGSAMGIVGLVIAFAPAVGPSLSGVLVDTVGWRALFIIVAVAAICVIIAAKKALSDQGPFDPATFDKPSVVLLAIGMVGLLYGLSSFASSENVLIPIVLMIVGIIFMAFFVKRQLKLEVPLLKVDVLKARRFRIISCIVPFLQAMLVGSGVIFPIYIQSALGYSATVSGLTMLPGAVLGAFCGLMAGRFFDKHGVRIIAILGGCVLALSGVGMVLLSMDTSIFFVMVVSMLLTIGLQLLTTPLNTWGVNSLDNRVIQHGNALLNTLNQVGASFGTALIMSLTALGVLFESAAIGPEAVYAGDHIGFIGMCVMLFAILLGIVFFVRDKKGERGMIVAPIHAKPQTSDVNTSLTSAERSAAVGVDLASGDVEDSDLTVGMFMDRAPHTVQSEATVREALSVLAETSTSGIVVVDKIGRPVGFVSDGDIMRYLGDSSGQFTDATMYVYRIFDDEKLKDRAQSLLDLQVMEIATKKLITLQADESIDKACRLLAEKRIKKAPVISSGVFVGTLSRRNVVAALNASLEREKK